MAPTPAATPAPLPAVTRLRKPAPRPITGIAGTRSPHHRVASSNNAIDDRPDRIAGRTGVLHDFPPEAIRGEVFCAADQHTFRAISATGDAPTGLENAAITRMESVPPMRHQARIRNNERRQVIQCQFCSE